MGGLLQPQTLMYWQRARSKTLQDKMYSTLGWKAYSHLQDDIQQTLGRALGYYPWFCDDQKNFPGATKADGVCVGEHVAESIADEAGTLIINQRREIAAFRERNFRYQTWLGVSVTANVIYILLYVFNTMFP